MAMLGYLVGIVLTLGWIPLLVLGVIRLVRKKTASGIVFTSIGCLWPGVLFGLAVVLPFIILNYDRPKPFDPTKFTGRTGLLTTGNPGDGVLNIEFDENDYVLNSADGNFVLPAGAVKIEYYALIRCDTDGNAWQVSCSMHARNRIMTVSSSDTNALMVGPPFVAEVKPRFKNGTVDLDLKLTGRDGENYTLRKIKSSEFVPGFEVVNQHAKVVWSGNFSYG